VSDGVNAGAVWLEVRVRPGADREAAAAALFAAGAQGVQEVGDELVTVMAGDTDANAVVCAVLDAAPDARVDTAVVPQVDWSIEWRKRIGAHQVGRLVVSPPWLAGQHDPATTIVIDPGMAFGTGEHATTRGVMRLMGDVIRPGDRVADLGAGSAVLSIAAAKLGAARVAAIELDPEAIGNAEENVVRNGVGDVVTVLEGDAAVLLPLVAPVRVVLANIISSVLVELLPVITSALEPDGRALLSGILQEERDDLALVLDELGWRILAEDREDIWWSALIARR
jgi:ribosomal protein L11 methyltransferase